MMLSLKENQSKSSFLKIVSVCLLRETSIPSHLKEIDAVRYGHKQFYCIHEYFLERFAISLYIKELAYL